jgi:hypothetical protein
MYTIAVTFEFSKGPIGSDGKLKASDMENEGRKTISVPEAGRRYFELGKNASYEAARRGELPVIKIGGRLRVPVIALERMLSEARSKNAA